jgi:hypothetical protein
LLILIFLPYLITDEIIEGDWIFNCFGQTNNSYSIIRQRLFPLEAFLAGFYSSDDPNDPDDSEYPVGNRTKTELLVSHVIKVIHFGIEDTYKHIAGDIGTFPLLTASTSSIIMSNLITLLTLQSHSCLVSDWSTCLSHEEFRRKMCDEGKHMTWKGTHNESTWTSLLIGGF